METWESILKEEYEKPYYPKLINTVLNEYVHNTVYPEVGNIPRSLKCTPFDKVKVVILGQDPYIRKNQADGLSFSVNKDSDIPASLINIFRELVRDLKLPYPSSGDLTPWANEGVLLLNRVLTVREGASNSHKGLGWENLTDRLIYELGTKKEPVVFMLWGKSAQEVSRFIDSHHLVIESSHPSPYSVNRGFYGSKPFSQANEYLISKDISPVNWELPSIYH